MAKPTTKVSSIAWSQRGDTSMERRDPLLMKPLPGLNQRPCQTAARSQQTKRSPVRTLVRLNREPTRSRCEANSVGRCCESSYSTEASLQANGRVKKRLVGSGLALAGAGRLVELLPRRDTASHKPDAPARALAGASGLCEELPCRRNSGGGARSRLAGRGGVAEGPGSRHSRQVAHLHSRRGPGRSGTPPAPGQGSA